MSDVLCERLEDAAIVLNVCECSAFLVAPWRFACASQLRVFEHGPRMDTLFLMADPPLKR